jgi:hypothetical protein
MLHIVLGDPYYMQISCGSCATLGVQECRDDMFRFTVLGSRQTVIDSKLLPYNKEKRK